jgi:hypothetical protein
MAKRKPTLTLMEMERKLGYNINSLNYPDEGVNCFYSDLRPVPQCIYDTKNEVLQAMTVLKVGTLQKLLIYELNRYIAAT